MKPLLCLLAIVITTATARAAAVFEGSLAPADPRFEFRDGATVVKDAVEVDTTAATEGEWHEFLNTVPAKEGDKGHKEFSVTLSHPDYRLILGVHFGGAIRIENLKIEGQSKKK
jgi:hypothetical protein